MASTNSVFPAQVTVIVKPPLEGLAVRLCFEMKRKNNFSYVVFTNAAGTAAVSREELMKSFDIDRTTFMMDYVDPRNYFAGRITGSILNAADLENVAQAFKMLRADVAFPPGYEEKLRTAVAQSCKLAKCEVLVEAN